MQKKNIFFSLHCCCYNVVISILLKLQFLHNLGFISFEYSDFSEHFWSIYFSSSLIRIRLLYCDWYILLATHLLLTSSFQCGLFVYCLFSTRLSNDKCILPREYWHKFTPIVVWVEWYCMSFFVIVKHNMADSFNIFIYFTLL